MKKIKILIFIFLFLLLVFLSLVPRSVEVLSGNYLFGFDQGRDLLAVKSIVIDHKPTLIGSEIGAGSAGFKGIFHGPFHYYFLAIPFFIFSGDPYGGMVLMLIFSLASITFAFYLARKLFGTNGGLITALLVAICPPLISQARFIWNSHPSTLFILLSFYFLYLSFKDKKFIFLASFFASFIYNFELAIAIPMSIAVIIFTVLFLKLKELKYYLLLVLGIILPFSPMILFELKHDFIGLRGIYDYIFVHKETNVTVYLLQILLKEHFSVFIYNFFDTFPTQRLIPPFLFFLSVFFPLVYYLKNEKNKYIKKFLIFLLILIPVNFLVFALLRNAVYIYYLIDLNLAYIFFFSYSFWSAFNGNNFLIKIYLTAVLLILLVSGIISAVKVYSYDINDYGGDAKIKGRIAAIDYIYNDAKKEKFSLLIFSPPVYTYPYDYLLWWYGEKKYGYQPNKDKKGLFYLLMEKDASKPLSYKGWMETVVKTGEVMETRQLPSGFLIQKRMEGKNEL
ncbi:hypothetical protein C4559_03350 [Candidatus Microgenomates bacterium]|nr:MAG: hypothetical protein C4559_03350 [Candidatus Microgenomates bacterium]